MSDYVEHLRSRPMLSDEVTVYLNGQCSWDVVGYRLVMEHPVKPLRLVMAVGEAGEEIPRRCLVIDNENRIVSSGDILTVACKDEAWSCVPKFSLSGDSDSAKSVRELSFSEAQDAMRSLQSRKMQFPIWLIEIIDLTNEVISDYFGVFGHFDEIPDKPYYWLKVLLCLVGRKFVIDAE